MSINQLTSRALNGATSRTDVAAEELQTREKWDIISESDVLRIPFTEGGVASVTTRWTLVYVLENPRLRAVDVGLKVRRGDADGERATPLQKFGLQ